MKIIITFNEYTVVMLVKRDMCETFIAVRVCMGAFTLLTIRLEFANRL